MRPPDQIEKKGKYQKNDRSEVSSMCQVDNEAKGVTIKRTRLRRSTSWPHNQRARQSTYRRQLTDNPLRARQGANGLRASNRAILEREWWSAKRLVRLHREGSASRICLADRACSFATMSSRSSICCQPKFRRRQSDIACETKARRRVPDESKTRPGDLLVR